jgi:hypothetical protein
MGLSVHNRKNKEFFILLIGITCLLKLSLAVYFSYLGECKNPERSIGYLAKTSGDTFSYIGSIDNFVSEGVFYFWNGERRVFAGRMPYYGGPYYFLRLLFDKSLASDLFVLMQILFDAVATIYFGKLCRNVLKRKSAFWIGYTLYFLSFNFFETALLLAPESLSMSFLILFFYAFHQYWSDKNKSRLWIANIFLSLAFLLKPYLAPVFLVFLAIYCYHENLFSIKKFKVLVWKTALVCLPIVLMLLPWFIRNIIILHQPITTQESMVAGYIHTDADVAFRRFSGGWGGDFTFWDSASAACYFKLQPPFDCTFQIPSYSLADGYTINDIEDVRADYLEFQRRPTPELEEVVVNKFNRLTEIYKKEKPFMFYIGSGFLRIKTMLWHTNSYNLPIHPSSPCFQPYQLLFKTVQFTIYSLALTIGALGLIWLTLKKKISLLFAFVPLFLTGFFSFYVWNMEARYFAHAYPVMLLGLAVAILWLYSKMKNWLVEKREISYNKFD